jgi:hypothetical protein
MKFNTYGRTDITPFTIDQDYMDEVMQRARAERAEVMRAAIGKFTAWIKGVLARRRLSKAWA